MSVINIIQFRKRADLTRAEQESYQREAVGTGATLTFTDIFDSEVSWHAPKALLRDVDGVILAGSGEFDFDGGRDVSDPARETAQHIFERIQPLVDHLLSANIPTFGICFGHQIMGKHCGATVIHDVAQTKVGSHQVHTAENATETLLDGIPESFMAQYGHKDSLDQVPTGTTRIASGEQCGFSALQYAPHIHSVQFHPELNAADIRSRLAQTPGYLPDGVSPDDVVHESPEASRILHTFFASVGK